MCEIVNHNQHLRDPYRNFVDEALERFVENSEENIDQYGQQENDKQMSQFSESTQTKSLLGKSNICSL